MPFLLPNERCESTEETQSTDPNDGKSLTRLILLHPSNTGLLGEGIHLLIAVWSMQLQCASHLRQLAQFSKDDDKLIPAIRRP